MARDPLAVLARVREYATREAKRALGAATVVEAQALALHADRRDAPGREQAAGCDALVLAAWLPRALVEIERTGQQAARMTAMREAARHRLVAARQQERVLETLRAQRALDAAQRAVRKDQAAQDDRAQRRMMP